MVISTGMSFSSVMKSHIDINDPMIASKQLRPHIFAAGAIHAHYVYDY